MKYILNSIIFTLILAAAAFGQARKPTIAVAEFTSDPATLTAGGAEAAQKGVYLWVRDITKMNTTSVKRTDSAAIQQVYKDLLGRPVDPPAAVKIGKILGVNYVMFGHVKPFDGRNGVAVQMQIVDVATGKVEWSDEASQTGLTKSGQGTLVLNTETANKLAQKLTPGPRMAELLRKTIEKPG